MKKASSGIYHPALYESARMKELKPERHSQIPGTQWYYNNWDFNAAGTAFEKLTGKKIFEAIEEEIAIPTGMEDFSAEDGWYVSGEESIHPAYPFAITAHDTTPMQVSTGSMATGICGGCHAIIINFHTFRE